jgi:hypothetical protein
MINESVVNLQNNFKIKKISFQMCLYVLPLENQSTFGGEANYLYKKCICIYTTPFVFLSTVFYKVMLKYGRFLVAELVQSNFKLK